MQHCVVFSLNVINYKGQKAQKDVKKRVPQNKKHSFGTGSSINSNQMDDTYVCLALVLCKEVVEDFEGLTTGLLVKHEFTIVLLIDEAA